MAHSKAEERTRWGWKAERIDRRGYLGGKIKEQEKVRRRPGASNPATQLPSQPWSKSDK